MLRLRIWAAWGCLALAICYFGVVVLMACAGGVWAHVFYAENVGGYVSGCIAALLGWYLFGTGYRNTAREWALFAAKCLMCLFSFSVAFLACEVMARAYLAKQEETGSLAELQKKRAAGEPLRVKSTHPLALIIEPSIDGKLVYTLLPNLNMVFGHHSLKTNSDGMRDSREYAKERQPHSVRIVGIGDSGMFGWDLDQGQDYMTLLENNLNKRNDGVTYDGLNFGTPGYNTELEVELLRARGLAYHPDVVVVGWCENDFFLPFFVIQNENFKRRDVSYLYMALFQRKEFQKLAAGPQVRDRRTFDYEEVSSDLISGTEAAGVTRALQELKSLGAANGFKILVFGPLKPDIVGICKEVGLNYYNTYEQIPEGQYPEEWKIHFMHPRAEGHRVLAEHLEKELDRLGWLKPRASN